MKSSNYTEAEKVISQALSECEENGNLSYLAAMIYKQLGDTNSYISYLSSAIKNYQTLSLPVQAVKDELNAVRQA